MFVIDNAFPIAKTHTKNMIHVTISNNIDTNID